jgi:hypothetical protein
MKQDGTPAFALNEVSVTKEQAENGIHYYLAEAQLLLDGLQEPFVHFDENEAPAFLHPAVRQLLGIANNAITPTEASTCSASSK